MPASLDPDPPTYASHLAGMTDVIHHAQFLLVEMDGGEGGGLSNFLPGLAISQDFPNLHLSS
jgi:hypothetical protein